MKKTMAFAAAACAGILMIGGMANAQLFPYTGATTTPSSSVINATGSTMNGTTSSTVSTNPSSTILPLVTAQPIVETSTPAPALPVSPSSTASGTTATAPSAPVTGSAAGEYIQMDGLIVTGASASSTGSPSIITAENLNYPSPNNASGTFSITKAVACREFATNNSPTDMPITCPIPPVAAANATATTSGSTSSAGALYAPFTITIAPTTQILFDNRTPATLADFAAGDTMNVYGYYNGNGMINAAIVRDTSAGTGPATGGATGTVNIAALQTQITRLESLVLQLEAEVATTTASSSTPSSSSVPAAPMVPYIPSATMPATTSPSTTTSTAISPGTTSATMPSANIY